MLSKSRRAHEAFDLALSQKGGDLLFQSGSSEKSYSGQINIESPNAELSNAIAFGTGSSTETDTGAILYDVGTSKDDVGEFIVNVGDSNNAVGSSIALTVGNSQSMAGGALILNTQDSFLSGHFKFGTQCFRF